MRFYFYPIIFLPFLYGFHYQEIFSYKKPLFELLHEENFFRHFHSKKNLEINKTNDRIEMSYYGNTLGYHYKSNYVITKNIDSFHILYHNSYLTNNITIEKINPSKIKVTTDTDTFIPVPPIILRKIIRSKLHSLFS